MYPCTGISFCMWAQTMWASQQKGYKTITGTCCRLPNLGARERPFTSPAYFPGPQTGFAHHRNHWLAWWAPSQGARFINACHLFTFGRTGIVESLFRDGMHLNAEGLSKLGDKYRQVLGDNK